MEKGVKTETNLEINSKLGQVTVSVNPKIYPLDVVLSAAYVFTERCYVLVDGDPNEEIIVELRPKDSKKVDSLGHEFNNELLNYANYAVQIIKNEKLRETILNRVMMTNSIEPYAPDDSCVVAEPIVNEQQAPSENPDKETKPWFDDPEGIAVPWEEKYGKSQD